MESVSGEKGVKELAMEGTPVEVIEGNGDNTLIVRVKSNSDVVLKKKFDRNHIVKNIGKSLYALHADKSVNLSKSVILHLQKCLKYIIAKNQGNAVVLEQNLRSLIPHQFGDHSLCQPSWCGFKREHGKSYKHRSLPYKAALKDELLRSKLDGLFESVIDRAHQHSDLGCSQQCEHANREVTMRAPKSLHYGNSESLDFRVKATAACINDGRHYISEAHSEAGISPGFHSVRYAEKCMQHRKRVQDKSQLPSSKRRRLILQQERAITQGAQEALEGVSYQSEIGYAEEVDIEKLPDPVPRGIFKPVKLSSGEPSYITFDLGTTDLIRGGVMPHITQLATVHVETGSAFERYIVPKVPITNDASEVTGIVMSGPDAMKVNGKPVQAVPIKQAFEDCFKWLQLFSCVFLLAHNGKRFDFPVVVSTVARLGFLTRLLSLVTGFVDSLPLFRKVYPNRITYKQEELMKDIIIRTNLWCA